MPSQSTVPTRATTARWPNNSPTSCSARRTFFRAPSSWSSTTSGRLCDGSPTPAIGPIACAQSLVVRPLFQLGMLARQEGDLDRAEALMTESLRIVRQAGSQLGFESAIHVNLGQVADDQ